jgi:hypothetical protein
MPRVASEEFVCAEAGQQDASRALVELVGAVEVACTPGCKVECDADALRVVSLRGAIVICRTRSISVRCGAMRSSTTEASAASSDVTSTSTRLKILSGQSDRSSLRLSLAVSRSGTSNGFVSVFCLSARRFSKATLTKSRASFAGRASATSQAKTVQSIPPLKRRATLACAEGKVSQRCATRFRAALDKHFRRPATAASKVTSSERDCETTNGSCRNRFGVFEYQRLDAPKAKSAAA